MPKLEEHDRLYLRQILDRPISAEQADNNRKSAMLTMAVADLHYHLGDRQGAANAFLLHDIASSRARDCLGQSARAF